MHCNNKDYIKFSELLFVYYFNFQISEFSSSPGVLKKYDEIDGRIDSHWRPIHINCGLCKQR